MPVRRSRLLACTVLVLSLAALTGCTGSEEPTPVPSSVPLDELDLSGLRVAREPFCGELDEPGLRDVLGGDVVRASSYRAGDRAQVEPGVDDAVSEHGCAFEGEALTARTWVFAQPVDEAQARLWVAEADEARGCSPAGLLEFGDPGLTQLCRADGQRQVRMAGLFGDAWLTCEVGGPLVQESVEVVERWCADVAVAAALP